VRGEPRKRHRSHRERQAKTRRRTAAVPAR
jgi:hypothetical protein